MVPLARVAHALPGRTRIKIEERRGDEAYFTTVKERLAGCPGIAAVEANSLTASVLVRHAASNGDVLRYAAEHGLFCLAEGEPGIPSADRLVAANLETADRGLRAVSGGGLNLRSMMFLGLVGLGIAQAIEGNIAVPALTAFWYALSALPRANDQCNMKRRSQDAESPGNF